MKRRKPDLSDADAQVWRQLSRSVKPLGQRADRVTVTTPMTGRPRPAPASDTAPALPALTPQGIPVQKRPPPRPSLARLDPLAQGGHLRDMDARTARRLRQGRTALDATLDLHGLTQIHAHDALASFLRKGQARGWRCVLVITGKGFRAGEPGVLRQALPGWLDGPGLRPLVVGYSPARIEDGGAGAVYVLIRRLRD
ncbi:Smr/MutS family protein [Pararhodospirillum oryzae]|uniref:Smr protein/Muts2-like n=1 Tax=Pararhodospirillum oryzae TaxID=478448 RepID=A0A512H662_9PROT|nr:Smr/MutS family protein [Pararhodospirillum oryzae]GEO80880.1 smr protein/Muts2-like [Pararhodospirillum oryzae]